MSWIKKAWKPLFVLAVVIVALVLLGAAWMFFFGRGCGDEPRSSASQSGDIPPGWEFAAQQTTPLIGKNKASEYTAAFPAGSKVVVVETQNGEQVEIGILPDGEVVVPKGTKATVYVKRPAIIAAECRPFIFGGLGLGGGYVGGGVDLVRVWRLHGGVGAAATYWPNEEERDVDVGVIAKASVNVWRNVDLVGGGGYGTAGEMAFGGVAVAIQ